MSAMALVIKNIERHASDWLSSKTREGVRQSRSQRQRAHDCSDGQSTVLTNQPAISFIPTGYTPARHNPSSARNIRPCQSTPGMSVTDAL